MIELGDKYLCKKSNKGHDFDIGVEENIWYEVVKVDGIPKELEDLNLVRFAQLNDGKSVFNISFCITSAPDYIWDYFYTEKELRKKKLDQIIK